MSSVKGSVDGPFRDFRERQDQEHQKVICPAQGAVEDARAHPEGRTANVVDAEPINIEVTTTPKKRSPTLKETKYRHLTPDIKNAIVNSVMSGSSYRTASKVFGVSLGTISSLIKKSQHELSSRTQAGGRRESTVKVTPNIVRALSEIVSRNPQYSLREMRAELIEKESVTLSTSSIFSLLRNTEIACKRLYREPPERNSSQWSAWGGVGIHIYELRGIGCQFLSIEKVAPTSL